MKDLCLDVYQRRGRRQMFVINQFNAIDPNKIVLTIAATANFVAGIKVVFASGALTIDWKDGSAAENFTTNVEITHTYVNAGTYYPEISGNLTNITTFVADNCKISAITNLKTGALSILNITSNSLTSIDLSKINIAANGLIDLKANPNLASVALSGTYTGPAYRILLDGTDLNGTLDLSKIGVGAWLDVNGSEDLTSIIFKSSGNSYLYIIYMNDCDLGYIDFTGKGFTFALNGCEVRLHNNNMTAAEVNHYLVDFDSIATSGYTGRKINIGGTNESPDSSSGGYDGLAAKASLEGKGFTVTV